MLSQKQPRNDFTQRQYVNQELIDKVRDSDNHLSEQVARVKQKLKIIENKKPPEQKPALQTRSDLINYNEVTVTRLLAKRFEKHFNADNYQKSIRELQVALMTLSGLIILVSGSWLVVSNTNFLAHGDFSYNAGLLGGFLMLCSICYALMKRIRFVNALGHNETWYYAHLLCGVAGPVLIILHTAFQLKSINSTVAFVTMLVVMLSGMFGRYIFTMLSYKAHLVYQAVGELELSLLTSLQQHQLSTTKAIKTSLTQLVVSGLKKPNRWYRNLPQMVKLPFYAIRYYFTLRRELRGIYITVGKRNAWDKATLRQSLKENKRLVRRYTLNIIKLSLLSMTQNLLQNWRTLHANLLYLLTLTAVAHIVAVHMY